MIAYNELPLLIHYMLLQQASMAATLQHVVLKTSVLMLYYDYD